MNTLEISIRSIQHYLYCPHRWGLLEIDRAWAENAFVTKANLLHSRVHDSKKSYSARGKQVFTSVPVFNDLPEYNLYGITDCMELTEDAKGVSVNDSSEKYKICIVEYKPTKPRDKEYNEDDLMQVFAQKISVDYVFGCDCDAAIYYADVKKRVSLPLRENFAFYSERLKTILTEMRDYLERGEIPAVKVKQKCNGCSMKDLCMPSLKAHKSFRDSVEEISRAEL